MFHSSSLPCDKEGFLLVEDTLQGKAAYPFIFGAGDCVSLNTYRDLPKNGVYAVSQGEILLENIMSYLKGEECHKFRLQKRFLSILSTGNHEAFMHYGGLSYHGKLAWKLKNWIDEGFMRIYR